MAGDPVPGAPNRGLQARTGLRQRLRAEAVVCVSNRWDAVRLLQRAPWPGSFLVWLSEQCWELHAAAEHEAELSEAVRALPEWARVEPPRVSGAA